MGKPPASRSRGAHLARVGQLRATLVIATSRRFSHRRRDHIRHGQRRDSRRPGGERFHRGFDASASTAPGLRMNTHSDDREPRRYGKGSRSTSRATSHGPGVDGSRDRRDRRIFGHGGGVHVSESRQPTAEIVHVGLSDRRRANLRRASRSLGTLRPTRRALSALVGGFGRRLVGDSPARLPGHLLELSRIHSGSSCDGQIASAVKASGGFPRPASTVRGHKKVPTGGQN